jgi:large subunit ribosomal protein L28
VSRRCQLTWREPGFGKSVSHSHRRTSRRWDPNIQSKRYWYPAEGRFVRLRLSADAIRTIDRIGVDAAVAKIKGRGATKKGRA